MKVVFVPCVTNKPIVSEVIRTFDRDDSIRVVHLTTIVVNNYASEELNKKLLNEMKNNIIKWVAEGKDKDVEFYVVLTGGVLQSVIAVHILDALSVPYKLLVYEKKLGKYVVFDADGRLLDW